MLRHYGNRHGRALAQGVIAAVIASLPLLASAEAPQRPSGPAVATARQATAAGVKARLDAEAAAIAAEPAFEGLDKLLSHYIRATLPGWAPLGRSDADPADANPEPGQSSPFICSGDFDGNGLKDTAAVMKQHATGAYRVMAFHQVMATENPGNFRHRGYEAYELAEAPADSSIDDLTVACNGPGAFESVEGDITVQLSHDSIEYGEIEYYFSNGAYHSVVIGD